MEIDTLLEDFTNNKGYFVITLWDRYKPYWRVSVGVTVDHSGGESVVYGLSTDQNLVEALLKAEEDALGKLNGT